MSDAIVKNLSFGEDARIKVFKGIQELTKAVSSTLGASGKRVLLEDASGMPIITKDGVTVADSIILRDPVENMGATLLKEAARKTVREAGDGTTTATVLAHSILEEAYKVSNKTNLRELKDGINSAVVKVVKFLELTSVPVTGSMIDQIATISTNNDPELGNNKPLLIIGDLDQGVLSALAMNKMKGNIKVNVIDAPTFGISKKEVLDDLSLLTGATIINEDLGDDMDMIQVEYLGTCLKSVTSHDETVIQVKESSEEVLEIIEHIKSELLKDNLQAYQIIKLEKRLAMLAAKIAIVKIGANSDIELKEKTDRVEDAICATKAAIKEGIVSGGGIALLNASKNITSKSEGESVLLEAIKAPFKTILDNAGINNYKIPNKTGEGLNVVTGKTVNMIKHGIIDPLLVTKSALINAASVATTILSTDCVINNLRIDESNR